MAKSKLQSTVAVLRQHLGKYKTESMFGALINKSESWVKKVSINNRPLSREAALLISIETNISPEWLLANDTSIAPKTIEGEKYNLEAFLKYRAGLNGTKSTLIDPLVDVATDLLPSIALRIARTYQAHRRSRQNVELITKYLDKMLDTMSKEFPLSAGACRAETERSAIRLCRSFASNLSKKIKSSKIKDKELI
jgi:hypothetical protein